MTHKNHKKNHWSVEDERNHPSRRIEWWSFIGFFRTQDNQKQWSVKATLSDGFVDKKNIDSLINIVLFDHDEKHHYTFLKRHTGIALECKKDIFEIHYDDSWIKGKYPRYELHIRDSNNDIDMDFLLEAESLPHWVAQESTNGWLPMGFGRFRYGFIPKLHLSGSIKIHGAVHSLLGVGYFEHVWGDFMFLNPLMLRKGINKTISTYFRLGLWWLHGKRFKIPKQLRICGENNPLGYDWAWVVLENGWTVFYGNILFWLMQGPAAGIVILSKDGKTYTEFSNVTFRYNKIQSAKSFDFVYPSEFEITAKKGKEKIHLKFVSTHPCHEYIKRFAKTGFWRGFVICESSGLVTGLHQDCATEMPLKGIGRIEPQRQLSVLGHNSLRIDVVKPPIGVGFMCEIDSHFFGKKICVLLNLAPKPMFRLMINKTRITKNI